MRLATFVPLYAGVLACFLFLMPAWNDPEGSAVAVPSLEPFPHCWQLVRTDYFGKPYHSGPFPLKRERLKYPFNTNWYQAGEREFDLVAWAPAQGDSFDIEFYHDPTIRFPRGKGPVVGRVYFSLIPSVMMALLWEPQFAVGEEVECPRSGGTK